MINDKPCNHMPKLKEVTQTVLEKWVEDYYYIRSAMDEEYLLELICKMAVVQGRSMQVSRSEFLEYVGQLYDLFSKEIKDKLENYLK